jgi:hypothetical protein
MGATLQRGERCERAYRSGTAPLTHRFFCGSRFGKWFMVSFTQPASKFERQMGDFSGDGVAPPGPPPPLLEAAAKTLVAPLLRGRIPEGEQIVLRWARHPLFPLSNPLSSSPPDPPPLPLPRRCA